MISGRGEEGGEEEDEEEKVKELTQENVSMKQIIIVDGCTNVVHVHTCTCGDRISGTDNSESLCRDGPNECIMCIFAIIQ